MIIRGRGLFKTISIENNSTSFRTSSNCYNKINSINSLEQYKKNKVRLIANLINNYFIKYLSREFNFYNYYLNHFSNYKSRNINYNEFIKKYSYILCDASEFVKPYLKEFALSARSNMKISMCHGSDFPYYNKNFLKKKNRNIFGYNFKIILFSKNSNEKNYYQKLLNLKKKNYYLIGNPKHSKSWINFIKNKLVNKKDNFFKKKYVFLISRHSDKNYLPAEKEKVPSVVNESGSDNFSERELMYKFLFDMKKDLTKLEFGAFLKDCEVSNF
jgi:hypothetical protein